MGPLNKRSEPLTKVFCIHFFILFTTFVETLSDRYHYVSIYLLLSRFAINLLNGTSPDDDIALHINPRRDQGEIVFNSREGGSWGKEKRKKLPSAMEEKAPFTLEILAKSDKFKVTNKNCTNLSFSQWTCPICLFHKGQVLNIFIHMIFRNLSSVLSYCCFKTYRFIRLRKVFPHIVRT